MCSEVAAISPVSFMSNSCAFVVETTRQASVLPDKLKLELQQDDASEMTA
jgi:hypothetical protein